MQNVECFSTAAYHVECFSTAADFFLIVQNAAKYRFCKKIKVKYVCKYHASMSWR